VIQWVLELYSSKRYEEDSDSSEDIPVPRFRDLGQPKHRFTRTYELREKKPVCYTEEDDEGLD
jgi:hypothetical protein